MGEVYEESIQEELRYLIPWKKAEELKTSVSPTWPVYLLPWLPLYPWMVLLELFNILYSLLCKTFFIGNPIPILNPLLFLMASSEIFTFPVSLIARKGHANSSGQ